MVREEEVFVAICKKKMIEDGVVNGGMERVISKKGWKNSRVNA